MTWHRSPLLATAVMAIAAIVGWTLLLNGGITGQSFGYAAFNAPSPRYGALAKGFEFGPYGEPYDTRQFLEVQRLCSPDTNPQFRDFPPDQHECCRRMCNDACNAYTEQRPGTCLAPCLRGCTRNMYYDLP